MLDGCFPVHLIHLKHFTTNNKHSPYLRAETHLNNIQEFTMYLKENTTLHHYKDQMVNTV
jgi:hypothetical protein